MRIPVLLTLIASLWCQGSIAKSHSWQAIALGLDYLQISTPSISTHGRIHAFKISLENYFIDTVLAKDYDKLALPVAKFAHKTASLVTINGGFFSPNYQPLGLRIQHGNIRSPLKNTSWWGIFYIKNHQAHIINPKQYHAHINPDFAIQAGPRLVINGNLPSLKGGYAERSALCIVPTGEVAVIITERAPLTATQFAQILQRPLAQGGIGCQDALNLDGGSSSQLYVKLPNFSLSVISFHDITDAITIKPRTHLYRL